MRAIAVAITLVLPVAELISAGQAPREAALPRPVGDALVDIGGRRLHVSCVGEGSPTVILEAGLGDPATIWSAVQSAAATITRVCSYDRAGLGTSDPDPRPAFRTSQFIVEDLNLLLRAAALGGPYILVGHSLGGAHIRLFASRFPKDVAAMVFVDASHEDQGTRFKSAGLSQPLPQPGQNSERADMYASLEEVGRARWRADIPLVVLTHGRNVAEGVPDINAEVAARIEAAWLELQRELANRSAQGRLVVAQRSGHYVHTDEPELVVNAIREVVAAVRQAAR